MTPGTIAWQAHLSMEFPRQEYWSRLPFPPPEDLPDPGIEPTSPALAGRFLTTEPGKSYGIYKRTMCVHTKEEALALATVDIGGKHTQV